MKARLILAGLLATTLAGCGVIYHGTGVSPGVTEQGKVRVLPITPESVLTANHDPYTPRSLPAAFSQTAGTTGGLTSAPPAAVYERQSRPASVETLLPPPRQPEPYRIGVGDVVLLATPKSGNTVEQLAGVLAAENSRQGYTVQDDGTISIANVGRVEIAGQTIEDAEATLFQRFLDKQVDPTFSLEISEFNSKKVTIGGAVVKPTVEQITLSPLYLDQAISDAGGTTSGELDYTLVRLYREGKLYQVPLKDVYARKGGRILLAAGDIIFVDAEYDLAKAEGYFEQQLKLGSYRQTELAALQNEIALRRAGLSEERDTFNARLELGAEKRDYAYLTGEVGKQSRFALPFNEKASLADALYDGAGGLPAKTANPKHIYVLRGSSDPLEYQSITAWHLDARNAAAMLLATRFELHPNDVVYVAAQPVTHWSNVVNAITPSLLISSVNAATN